MLLQILVVIERILQLPVVLSEAPGTSSNYIELDALLVTIAEVWMRWSEEQSVAARRIIDATMPPVSDLSQHQDSVTSEGNFHATGSILPESSQAASLALDSLGSLGLSTVSHGALSAAMRLLTACVSADDARCGLLPWAPFIAALSKYLNWQNAAESRDVIDLAEYFCVNSFSRGEPGAPLCSRSWVRMCVLRVW